MLSVPIMPWCSTPQTRPDYLVWLQKVKADRIFLGCGMPYDDPEWNRELLDSLKENIEYYRHPTDRDGNPHPGFEIGIWIQGLGHGFPLPPEYAYLTERYQKITDLETGTTSNDSLCPLDDAYVKMYTDLLKRIASLHPDVIMIDDDYRLSGHGPVAIGCACALHMAEFNRRAKAAGVTAEDLSREDLASFLMNSPTTPHRNIWLSLMRDTLCNHANTLRAAVDEIDPGIRLGHCACLPTWDLDGADSIALSRCFAGERNRPFLRLIGAPYWGEDLGLIVNLERMQHAWCKQYAPEIELMSEGDVYPRPRFNVPASYLENFHQVLLCDGMPDILKYMFDYVYEPSYETGYLRLHCTKETLRAEMQTAFADTEGAGIYVFEAMHKLADADCRGCQGRDLFESFKSPAARYASRLGLPVSFEKTPYTPTVILFGENAKYADDDTLSRNLILDATAARVLTERGYDIGVTAITPTDKPCTENIGSPKRTYPVDTDGRFYHMSLMSEATVLSTFDTGNAATVCYTRKDGKTVLIYAFDMDKCDMNGVFMKNEERRIQILSEASFALTVCVPEPGLYTLCRRSTEKTVVGIWNFGRDIGLTQTISLEKAYSRVTPIGETQVTLSEDGTQVLLDNEIPPFCFAGFILQ